MKAILALALSAVSLLPIGSFAADPEGSRGEFAVRDNRGGFTGVARALGRGGGGFTARANRGGVTGVARALDVRAVVREQGETFAADVEALLDAAHITT